MEPASDADEPSMSWLPHRPRPLEPNPGGADDQPEVLRASASAAGHGLSNSVDAASAQAASGDDHQLDVSQAEARTGPICHAPTVEGEAHVTAAGGGAAEREQAADMAGLPSPAGGAAQIDDEPQFGVQEEKKKKTRKKKGGSKLKRGAGQPCGFEEYYVDPPITPDEFERERVLYHPSKPFSERIQTAIQRYTARRKFDEQREALWTKYLRYGGIETSPKMFGGGADEPPEDATGADIITLKAKEYVAEEIAEDERSAVQGGADPSFVVDFDAVVRAFFSLHLRGTLELTSPQIIKTYAGVIRNWLNYLLHHNVCDDYKDDVSAARNTCDLAETQLTRLTTLSKLLPGTFGEACRRIYLPPEPDSATWVSWDAVSPEEDEAALGEANRVFIAALAAHGSDEICNAYSHQNFSKATTVSRVYETGLEFTAIEPPGDAARALYAHPVNHGLAPVGIAYARPWFPDWGPEEDQTEEEAEEAARQRERERDERTYAFWVDEAALEHMFVGLRAVADVAELSFGVTFLAAVKFTYPSYTLWIANEMMDEWREHVYIPPKGFDDGTAIDGDEGYGGQGVVAGAKVGDDGVDHRGSNGGE